MKNIKNAFFNVDFYARQPKKQKRRETNFSKIMIFGRFLPFFANFSLKKAIFCVFLAFFSLFSAFFANSCSSSKIGIEKNQTKLSPIFVTNSKKINLLENGEFSENQEKIDVVQLISGNFSDKNFEFLANLIIDNKEISLSLLSPMGADLGKVSYRDNFVNFDSGFFPKNIKAEYIIADIQNAYFPFEKLKQNFEKSGLTFSQEIQNVSPQDDSKNRENKTIIRKIYDKNQLIETISVFNDIIIIENNLRNYKYILQTLDENF